MRRLLLRLHAVLALLLLATLLAPAALGASDAQETYQGYGYNAWDAAVPMPAPYALKGIYNGLALGVGRLSEPEDLFYRAPYLYILDSGNNRVVVVDESFELVKVVDVFRLNGEEQALSVPQGLFVRENGEMLICDTGNNRVLITDGDGNILDILYTPTTDYYQITMNFIPMKVIEDSVGSIYILVRDFYYGALVYDHNGEFDTFYGANRIAQTGWVLNNLFWKRFMTEQQMSYMYLFTPTAYSGFSIDENDFIYTVTRETWEAATQLNQIKKLNKQGDDILRAVDGYDVSVRSDFGDKRENRMYLMGQFIQASFGDICVTEEGIITALDTYGGKVFQYSRDSDLLFIFGGKGDQQGVFVRPSAVESAGRDIIVLDSANGDITVYGPTLFADTVLDALGEYSKGRYVEAGELWDDVLKLNSNYELAYSGMGKALMEQTRYEESLWYFRQGHNRENYSIAFSYVRGEFLKTYFIWVIVLVVILVIWVFVGKSAKAMIRQKAGIAEREPSDQTPMHVATHLLNGFEGIRRSNRFSLFICALGINLLWFFAAAFARQSTGFIFNTNRPEDLNLLIVFAQTFGVLALFCTCNWAVTSLMGGEGNLRRIYVVAAYALFPYIVAVIIRTILSNAAVYEELALINAPIGLGIVWSVYLMWNGMKEVHQFSVKKNFGSLLLTVFGMMVVLFLIMLFFGLAQQISVFFSTIYNEIMFRTV